jgi:2-polyprenyl-3-methyl-5-hydroxy-6-metoxy-1,4-benzoquinol methylase
LRQLERIEEYFEKNAADWQDLYAKPRQVNDLVLADRRRIAVEKIRERVPEGGRVLDAGCGAGLVALDLLQSGLHVHGVDVAQGMLELCERRFREAGVASDRYRLTRGDVSRSGLAPASFAGVIALGFLEYQDDELTALLHFHRLLEPGGTLVISAPTRNKLANYLGLAPRVLGQLTRMKLLKEDASNPRLALHGYSVGLLRRLLADAGFEVEECRGHGFVEFEGIKNRLSYDKQVSLHHAVSRLASFLPIHRWGNNLVAVARKRA